MRLLKILLLLVALLAAALLWMMRPGDLDAVGWQAPPAQPLTGVLAENQRLADTARLGDGVLAGPEDVVVDADGNLFTGTEDGRIMRIDRQGDTSTFARTGGRPLGLAFAPDGQLIVADAYKGVLSVSANGSVQTLLAEVGGAPLNFADDVVVDRDGIIYISDASTRFGLAEFKTDLMVGRPYGRVLRFDPVNGDVQVLMDGLYFANGITLSPEQDFLLVNETYRYRVLRYWLRGERAGQHEVFSDNLPGFPDNISTRPNGDGYWVALPSRRNAVLDQVGHLPWMRNLIARLPAALQPAIEPFALVVALDNDGRLVDAPMDPQGRQVSGLTSVVEYDGALYLGALHGSAIGRWRLSPAP